MQTARASVSTSAPASAERVAALLNEARVLLRFDMLLAIQRANDAHRVASKRNDAASCAIALAIKAQAAARAIGTAEAKSAMQAAKAALPSNAAATIRAEVLLAAARLHWIHDEPPQCVQALREAFDLADNANANWLLVKANILSLSALGWPDQPQAELTRLLSLAQTAGCPSLTLECRVLLTVARFNEGEAAAARHEFAALLEEAKRLGDRSLQCYLEQRCARDIAPTNLHRALEHIRLAIDTAQVHGNREQLALAHDYAARLLLHTGQFDDAVISSQAAIAAITDLSMADRELTVYGTATHVALRAGKNKEARAYGEHATSLQLKIDQRVTPDQKTRLWHEANSLSHKLRQTTKSHEAELDAMTARQRWSLLYAAGALLFVLALASGLLLRDRKRLRRANAKLANALTASSELQLERTALKENLQQIERLDSIGLLAGGFAHDFNNILVSVRGNTQLTLIDPATTDSQRELLDQVLVASDRAAGLCKDILNYANSEPSPKDVVDVREAIEGMVPLARAGFGASVEVTMDLGDQSALVKVDCTQIEQVLLNVLVNAGDAIESHGKIHISVDDQQLDGSPPAGYWFGEFDGKARNYVAISVLDNGQGMNGETIRRIFDPFFSTRFAGRGLGLAAAFGILRSHQGIVEVQSAADKGTQFTIYLPKHDAAALPPEQPTVVLQPPTPSIPRPRGAITPATILVVDDEPTICEVIRGVLEVDGHTVITAQHGIDALELAEQYCDCLDLAILDVTMPGMDGPTLAQHLRCKVLDLPIVMMTGHAPSAVGAIGGESQLLLKPFDLQALRNTINVRLTAELSLN
ncbi:MAG: signal transduction histidine kinase [Planctomycetota bacterium]